MVMCRFLCVAAFSLLYLHTASKASKQISIILFFFRHSFRIFIYEWMVMCTQFWLVIDLGHYDKARQNKSFVGCLVIRVSQFFFLTRAAKCCIDTRQKFQTYGPINKKPPHLLVLHYYYNGEISQKWDLVITFDWGVLMTRGQCVWTAFCKIFSGTPHLTILRAPKYAPKYVKYGQICRHPTLQCFIAPTRFNISNNLKFLDLTWKLQLCGSHLSAGPGSHISPSLWAQTFPHDNDKAVDKLKI